MPEYRIHIRYKPLTSYFVKQLMFASVTNLIHTPISLAYAFSAQIKKSPI